jgi:cell volume regulation protein A
MSEFANFFPGLLVVATLLLVAVAAAPVAAKLGVPAPAAFLAVGIVAGLAGWGPFEDMEAVALEEIGAIALYAILFQGGLSTGFRTWRAFARPILLLGLPGTAATAMAVAAFGHFVLGLEWSLAAFIGIALAPTDPAAVYSAMRDGSYQTRARTILEGESGVNDPVGISLMVVAVLLVNDPGAGLGEGATRLAEELFIGLAGGVVGALLLTALLAAPRVEANLQAVVVLTGAVIVGAATAALHGSGFLAVYVTGLLIAEQWSRRESHRHTIPETAAGVAEPVLFGLLGASFAPLVGATEVWQGAVLTIAIVLVVRPPIAWVCLARSGFGRAERLLVSWGGLKGAVPLLLAAYPALEHLDEATATQATVLVATAASIVVQGGTLRFVNALIRPLTSRTSAA